MDERQLLGKHILAGITYIDSQGRLVEHRQVHGRVMRVNDEEGIVLQLDPSDEEFRLPPATDVLTPAKPGEYRLRSTGEVVVDPDYIVTYDVRRPKSE